MRHPLIIGIGGAHSGIGKTETAVALLKYFSRNALCVMRNEFEKKEPPRITHYASRITLRRWGAVKCTITSLYSSLTDDKAILSRKGKDTERLLSAGAEEVLWVQAPRREVGEVALTALHRLAHLDGVIVEGNSAIEFLKPDIVIFLVGASQEKLKPSSRALSKTADITIGRKCDRAAVQKNAFPASALHMEIGSWDEATAEELVRYIAMTVQKKNIEGLLLEKASDGKVSCGVARKIAEELGVPYKEVGRAADGLKIKIKNCELGCF